MKSVERMSLWGAVGLAVALGLAGPARGEELSLPASVVVEGNAQPAISDTTITTDIMARLKQLKPLHNAQVTIATQGGVVTVSGSVPSLFARDKTLETVRATPGVVSVDDQLRLDVSSPAAPSQN